MASHTQALYRPAYLLATVLSLACQRTSAPAPSSAPRATAAAPARELGILDSGSSTGTSAAQCGTTLAATSSVPTALASVTSGDAIVTPSNDTTSRLAVLSALSAVPQSLLQLFFTGGNGQIEIGDAAHLCKDTPLTADERALLPTSSVASCWQSSAGRLKMIVSADPQLIRFTLVRLFAYLQAEYLIPRLQDPAAPAPYNGSAWQSYVTAFVSDRAKLEDAFLADLAASNSPALAAMTQFHNSDPLTFGNMVYANAVDSYYCTPASRSAMANQFKGLYSVFTDPANATSPLAMLGD